MSELPYAPQFYAFVRRWKPKGSDETAEFLVELEALLTESAKASIETVTDEVERILKAQFTKQ